MYHPIPFLLILLSLSASAGAAESITTTTALVAAIRDGAEGATIQLAAGTDELEAPLEPKAGMTIAGAGMDKTIITGTAGWKPSTSPPSPSATTSSSVRPRRQGNKSHPIQALAES